MKFLKNSAYILFAVMMASCEKPLDLTPPDNIVEDVAFTSVNSLERGLNGVYAQFNNGVYDGDIYATALYSDEATLPTENNTGRGVLEYRWQITPSSGAVTTMWSGYYYAIDRANRLLAAIGGVETKSAAEEQTVAQIEGELLGLRAFGHLQLLINYANSYAGDALGIPYMERSEISSPSRLKVSEVLAKIKTDFTNAKPLIPSSFTTKTRITLAGINAIQARAALYAKKLG